MKTAALTLGFLLLSGCGFNLDGGPEGGLTSVTVGKNCEITFETGKEYGAFEGEFECPGGAKGKVKVTGVKAFDGQAVASQVQLEQAKAMRGLLEGVMPLVKAGAAAMGVPLPVAPGSP